MLPARYDDDDDINAFIHVNVYMHVCTCVCVCVCVCAHVHICMYGFRHEMGNPEIPEKAAYVHGKGMNPTIWIDFALSTSPAE